jgi:hypothetical protein
LSSTLLASLRQIRQGHLYDCCAKASVGSSTVAMISVFSICQPLFFTFIIFAHGHPSAVFILAVMRGSHPVAPGKAALEAADMIELSAS